MAGCVVELGLAQLGYHTTEVRFSGVAGLCISNDYAGTYLGA